MDDERVEARLDDDLADAMATVLERAEAGDGRVREAAMVTALGSDWGRLVDAGLVIEADDGYVIDDPTAVREALEDREGEAGWSRLDRAAGACALLLASGYYLSPVRDAVGETMHLLLGPMNAAVPFSLVVLVLALCNGLVSSALRLWLIDSDRLARQRERMQELKDRIEAARERGDEEAIEHLSREQRSMMGDVLGAYKQQLRPMAWAMLLTVPVFLWLRWLFLAPVAATTPAGMFIPVLGQIAWTARVIGPIPFWLAWYVSGTLVSSVVSRKIAERAPVGT